MDPKHLVMLRRFTLDPDARWTTVGQAQAIVHVLRRATSLLAVLPMGAGKSFLFGSLPLVEPGVTVVVLPLRALAADQIDAAEAHQRALEATEHHQGRDLSLCPWNERLTSDGLIAMPAETVAENPSFRIWMDVLMAQGWLNRIVLDEAHLMVTSSNYRPTLAHLCYLTSRAVPLIALTATLPPALESELQTLLGFPTWRVI
ncbi:ATP-dependent DNA helicase sgs1 [Ceratobasidium sp. 414]|nr:ATP-dependent DNA helicase sgs1 [Ceratobasidium sp. 414]